MLFEIVALVGVLEIDGGLVRVVVDVRGIELGELSINEKLSLSHFTFIIMIMDRYSEKSIESKNQLY